MKVLVFTHRPTNITATLDETSGDGSLVLYIPNTAEELGLPSNTDYGDLETVRIIMYAQLKFYMKDYIGSTVQEVLKIVQARIWEYTEHLMKHGTMMIP